MTGMTRPLVRTIHGYTILFLRNPKQSFIVTCHHGTVAVRCLSRNVHFRLSYCYSSGAFDFKENEYLVLIDIDLTRSLADYL